MKLSDILEKIENNSDYLLLSSFKKLSAENFWLELQALAKRGEIFRTNKIIENIPFIVDDNEINCLSLLLEIIKGSGKTKDLRISLAAMKVITNKNLFDKYCEKILYIWNFLTKEEQMGIAMSFHSSKQIAKCIEMLKTIYRKSSCPGIKLVICAGISASGDRLNNNKILIEALTLAKELEQENLDFITKKKIKHLKKNLENIILGY